MTTETEREAIVAWLDHWVLPKAASANEDYAAGWNMAMFNAAREIERGDHLAPPISRVSE